MDKEKLLQRLLQVHGFVSVEVVHISMDFLLGVADSHTRDLADTYRWTFNRENDLVKMVDNANPDLPLMDLLPEALPLIEEEIEKAERKLADGHQSESS